MKKLLLSIFIALTLQGVIAQNAFYDAQFLVKLDKEMLQAVIDANSNKFIRLSDQEEYHLKNCTSFLNNPFDSSIKELDLSLVKSAISNYNTFVNNEISSGSFSPVNFRSFNSGSGFVGSALFSIIPNVLSGNLSFDSGTQTKLLDGFVKYTAEEFKKAQTITYMRVFESTIGKVGELEVIFPNTYQKLKTMDPTKFPELGDEFKDVFNKDLKDLLSNLTNHIDNYAKDVGIKEARLKWLNSTNTGNIKNSNFYGSLKLATDLGFKLANNYHPVDLFNYLDSHYYEESNLPSLSSKMLHEKVGVVIHGLNIIQSNLIDVSKNKEEISKNPWINFEQLKQLDTAMEWKYFVGLIYQQDKTFFNTYFFNPSSATVDNEIKKMKKRLNDVLTTLIEIRDIKSSLSKDNQNDNYLEYMRIIAKTLGKINTTNSQLNDFFDITENVLNIYDNVRNKDYSNTIHYLQLIFDKLFTDPNLKLNINQNIFNELDKYAAFMTDVINTKDSDAVKEVIRKHVAPAASFINKREYSSTFSVSSQPGYFISSETLNSETSFVSGITLPVGFELTFKLNPKNNNAIEKKENRSSLGIFAQLLDLGAMLNFRISDETSTLPDKVQVKQIFSPGASINYGFKNSPLTIGFGYQYTSELRKITLENGNEEFPNAHRVFLRLGWDIPLINISKSKKK